MKVVALGGGHGLAASLSALRRLQDVEPTGVVTVADNGGSSGRLRNEFGILPPGDLRMALAALCSDDEWGRTWARILQHRFGGEDSALHATEGDLRGHSVGNLLIAGAWDILGDHVEGLDLVGELLGARGRVLPMAAVPLDIEADVLVDDHPTIVRGQAEVATAAGQVVSVRLDPADPPACPEAVEAVMDADWVVIGPGSWFTSVMPTLLVPQLRGALVTTDACKALVLNLVEQPGETSGLSPVDHLDVLQHHAPDLDIDVIVADESLCDHALERSAKAWGAELVMGNVAREPGSDQHDPERLADVFRGCLHSPVK